MAEKQKSEIQELSEFIRDHMVTKSDLAATEKRLDDRIDGLIVKVDGIQNTIDREALVRADQKLPERVAQMEKHLDSQSAVWRR